MGKKESERKFYIWVFVLGVLAIEWMHHGYSLKEVTLHFFVDISIVFILALIIDNFWPKDKNNYL